MKRVDLGTNSQIELSVVIEKEGNDQESVFEDKYSVHSLFSKEGYIVESVGGFDQNGLAFGHVEREERRIFTTFCANCVIHSTRALRVEDIIGKMSKIMVHEQGASQWSFRGVIVECSFSRFLRSGSSSVGHGDYRDLYEYKLKIGSELLKMHGSKKTRFWNDVSAQTVIQSLLSTYKSINLITKEIHHLGGFLKDEKKEHVTQFNETDYEFILRLVSERGMRIVEEQDKILFYYYGLEHNAGKIKKYNLSEGNLISSINTASALEFFGSAKGLSADYYSEEKQRVVSRKSGFSDIASDGFSFLSGQVDQTALIPSCFGVSLSDFDLSIYDAFVLDGLGRYADVFDSRFGLDSSAELKVIGTMRSYIASQDGGKNPLLSNRVFAVYPNDLESVVGTSCRKPQTRTMCAYVVGNDFEIEGEKVKGIEDLKNYCQKNKNKMASNERGEVYVVFEQSVYQSSFDANLVRSENQSSLQFGQSLGLASLKVLSPFAGENGGLFALPRIGDCVLIDFLGGDCDYPYIAGSFYQNVYQTGKSHPVIRSKSFRGFDAFVSSFEGMDGINGKKNELNFINYKEKGSENETRGIELNTSGNFKNSIALDYEQKIEKNSNIEILADQHINVGGNSAYIIDGQSQMELRGGAITFVFGKNQIHVDGDEQKNVRGRGDAHFGLGKVLVIGDFSSEAFERSSVERSADYVARIAGDSQRYVWGSAIYKTKGEMLLDSVGDMKFTTQNAFIAMAEDSKSKKRTVISMQNGDIHLEGLNLVLSALNDANQGGMLIFEGKTSSQTLDDSFRVDVGDKGSFLEMTSDSFVVSIEGFRFKVDKNGVHFNENM